MRSNDINIRDPYILVYNNKYYMYGTRGPNCWGKDDGLDCYISNNLENWEGPYEVFFNNGDFWADRNYWAPECHYYNGNFYIFATFKSESSCRGTQILISDNPKGPFVPHSDGPVTPKDWECLDGTLYLSPDNIPYMVFCHECVQINNGTICYMELSTDLKTAVTSPKLLFHASDASWVRPIGKNNDWLVTDGPFLYRHKSGDLLMLWSSFGDNGYAQAIARSDNGDITGNWIHEPKLMYENDGGHGMIFRGLDGKLYLTLHSPNESLLERPHFYELDEGNRTLLIKGY